MASYVLFYLNRGGKQVVPSADIDRMESPTSTGNDGEGTSTYRSVRLQNCDGTQTREKSQKEEKLCRALEK